MRRYGRIDQVSAHGTHTYTHPTLDEMPDGGWVKFDDAEAERVELEADLVWAAINGTPRPCGIRLLEFWCEKTRRYITVRHDGTPASILRAIRKTRIGK